MKAKYRDYIIEGTTFAIKMGVSYTTGIFFRLPFAMCINGFERALVATAAGGAGATVANKVGQIAHDWIEENIDYCIEFEDEDELKVRPVGAC